MTSVRRSVAFMAMLALRFGALALPPACAQTRLSDKDLEQRKNIDSDIKRFRSMFNFPVSNRSIRKTTQEKDAKALGQQLQQAPNSLFQIFKNTKKSDPDLLNCLDLSAQIDRLMQSTQFDSAIVSEWAKLKPQLNDIAIAFQLPGY